MGNPNPLEQLGLVPRERVAADLLSHLAMQHEPSALAVLRRLRHAYPSDGGVCDVVLLAVPHGRGQDVLDALRDSIEEVTTDG